MRLAILAFVMLPLAAQAQETTLPQPMEPAANIQSCPVGMTFNAATQSCGQSPESSSMPAASDGYGCGGSMAREVTS